MCDGFNVPGEADRGGGDLVDEGGENEASLAGGPADQASGDQGRQRFVDRHAADPVRVTELTFRHI